MPQGVEQLRLKNFVFVEWMDAETEDGWVEKNTIADAALPKVVSGGWVAHFDEHVVKLVGGMSGEDDGTEYINVQVIPRRMVLRVWRPTGVARYRGGARG